MNDVVDELVLLVSTNINQPDNAEISLEMGFLRELLDEIKLLQTKLDESDVD
jgi:hypothetical protein